MKTRTVAFLCALTLLTTLTVFAENVSGHLERVVSRTRRPNA